MLHSLNKLLEYTLQAEDGGIGRCKDFLFDDRSWTVRYMVADTGEWLFGRKVLISPISLGEPDWHAMLFLIRLSKQQIEDAPELQEDAPVSRQHEMNWNRHYGWPFYWNGTGLWGSLPYPGELYDEKISEEEMMKESTADEHLRSVEETRSYEIQTTDDAIAQIEDFIVDSKTWTIRHIIVNTRKGWQSGKQVAISPDHVNTVSWAESKIKIDLTEAQLKNSPEYNPSP